MALSTFSGRLKSRPDCIEFSSLPISLPNGLITVHSPYSVSNDDTNESTTVNSNIHKQSLNTFRLELRKNAGIKIKVFFILFFMNPISKIFFALKSVFRHICIFSQTLSLTFKNIK